MNEEVLTPILDWLDIIGIALFAISGAVIAAKERQSLMTMCFFALVTGVGGGTVRDLLIDAPVFWMRDFWSAPVCLTMALMIWRTPVSWWEGRAFAYADAAGLCAFTVLGSAKAITYGIAPVPAMLMGVVTGVIGGVIRDVVAGRQSILLDREIYVTAAVITAAMTGGGMFLAPLLGIADGFVWAAAFLTGFVLRCWAIRFEWSLPSYGGDEAEDSAGAQAQE